MKTITIHNVTDRDRVRFGKTFPGTVLTDQHAEILPGTSIRLFGVRHNVYIRDAASGKPVPGSKAYNLTFSVGDEAEYDSYNMHFTGTITAIAAKTVTIQERGGRAHRLSIYEFCWRNWDYNAEAIADRNLDVMMNT